MSKARMKIGATLALVSVLVLGGCVATSGVPKKIVVTPTKPLAADAVLWHAKAVIGAAVKRLRGSSDSQVAKALAVMGSGTISPERKFRYDGFEVRQVKYMEFTPNAKTPGAYSMLANLHFQDASGRTAAAEVLAGYHVEGNTVILDKAGWRPLYAAFPRASAFIVPASAFAKRPKGADQSYISDYLFAARNAVPRGASGAAAEGAYVVMVFAKDRIAPDARFQVLITDQQTGTGGFGDATLYANYDDGWRVAVVPGKFQVSASQPEPFWIKAVFTPGKDAAEAMRGARVVGLYSTKLR